MGTCLHLRYQKTKHKAGDSHSCLSIERTKAGEDHLGEARITFYFFPPVPQFVVVTYLQASFLIYEN